MTWDNLAVGAICSVITVFISQTFGYARFRGSQRVTGEAALWRRIDSLESELRRVYELLRKSGEECDERVHQAIEEARQEMREEMRRRFEWDGAERRRELRALNGEWEPFPELEEGP